MPANRREFMGRIAAAGMAAAGGLLRRDVAAADAPSSKSPSEPPAPEKRRLVIVVFGGGTRSSEAIDDPQHRYIPQLWKEMVPRGTLWTNMRVEHRVVHPNCNGSIKTGHWEWDDLDWSNPLAASDDFRDRPQAPPAARHGRVVVRLRLDPGQHGPQHGRRLWRRLCGQRRRAADHPAHDGRGDGTPHGGGPRRAVRPRPKRRPPPMRRLARENSRLARRPAVRRRAQAGSTAVSRRGARRPARPATTPSSPTVRSRA